MDSAFGGGFSGKLGKVVELINIDGEEYLLYKAPPANVCFVRATYADEAELMLRFGAVNACNLDGGTSSLLWFDGGYLNNSATVVGIRRIPTSFLVLPEGRDLP